jgi:hypothetical protein
MRLVLGLPFSTPLGKRLMLVHLVGRKTGKHYKQPISYVRDEDVLLTPGWGTMEAQPCRWSTDARPSSRP